MQFRLTTSFIRSMSHGQPKLATSRWPPPYIQRGIGKEGKQVCSPSPFPPLPRPDMLACSVDEEGECVCLVDLLSERFESAKIDNAFVGPRVDGFIAHPQIRKRICETKLSHLRIYSIKSKQSNHGSHQADRSQVHRRQGPTQAAGHKGSSQVSSSNRRSKEAPQVIHFVGLSSDRRDFLWMT